MTMKTKTQTQKARTIEELTTTKTNCELNSMSTKRLLAYYKAERMRRIKYRESFDTGWDYSFYIYSQDKFVLDILKEWEGYLNRIKRILNTRENVVKRSA